MKILIIEDEKSISDLIRMNLILEGFEAIVSDEGYKGLQMFKKEEPDLVILDLMLPDCDGFEILKEMQEVNYKTPIVILTAKSDQNDKLLGLGLGADDYITKPFDNKELILRIRNIFKRMKKSELNPSNEINIGVFKIIKNSRQFFINSEEIYLTKTEFDLMELLMNNHNQVLSREVLLNKIWGFESEVDTRAVDMTIQRLRKKLGAYGECIQSLYGIGYKFEANDEE
ncbi:MAG TPA: response regulator transcription factor [Defluviitoga sp.]|nr:response regulator transcription factor [Defluviitoga sp.]HPU59722.1 response regulator transcription factor [Defluviitoga tunisiensis]HPZ74347.1 response regulator transcription factor [Candidatus Pacearchaeota archaeon]